VTNAATIARALQVLTDLHVTDPEPATIRVTEIPPTDVDEALMVDGRATTYVRIEFDYVPGSQRHADHGIVEVPLAVWNGTP
jgi:hypothetical protein